VKNWINRDMQDRQDKLSCVSCSSLLKESDIRENIQAQKAPCPQDPRAGPEADEAAQG
jgi:hypothetical protein